MFGAQTHLDRAIQVACHVDRQHLFERGKKSVEIVQAVAPAHNVFLRRRTWR